MANPEHIKIFKAGKKAIDRWNSQFRKKDKFLDLSEADLRNIKLDTLDLSGANLYKANLSGSIVQNSLLIGANLQNANLSNATFDSVKFNGAADMQKVNLENSNFTDCHFDDVYMCQANLKNAQFAGSSLEGVDLSNSNLTRASFIYTQLTDANLSKAILDGIELLAVETTNWNISKVHCKYFFLLTGNTTITKRRIPEVGYLLGSEFEDRFKSRPTIEFVFKNGIGVLSPMALGLAVDMANKKLPKANLKLLDITARGGLPRAIIEIAEKIQKKDALALLNSYYEEKCIQLKREIANLKIDKDSYLKLAHNKLLLPAMGKKQKRKPKYPLEVRDEIIELKDKGEEWKEIEKQLNRLYPNKKYKVNALKKWYSNQNKINHNIANVLPLKCYTNHFLNN
jgi:uncharacterized protein YjbI with pentapeptide repeats